MSHDPNRDLVEALVKDLRPVSPSPRLRVGMAILGGLWVAVFASMALFGVQPNAGATGGLFSLHWGVVLGLGIIALGGSLASLAGAIPGRDSERTAGFFAAGVGAALAVGSFAVAGFSDAGEGSAVGVGLSCFAHSVGVALPAMGAIVWLSLRGWVSHPKTAAALGLAGASAFGAVATQMVCLGVGAQHLLVGHFGVPLILALVGTIPLGLLLRRTAY